MLAAVPSLAVPLAAPMPCGAVTCATTTPTYRRVCARSAKGGGDLANANVRTVWRPAASNRRRAPHAARAAHVLPGIVTVLLTVPCAPLVSQAIIKRLKQEIDRRTQAIRGCGEEIVRLRQHNKVLRLP